MSNLDLPSAKKAVICILYALIVLFSETIKAAEPIKIGLIHPTTGRYKEQGYEQAQGAILAIEEINAQGGILGRPIELLTANTASRVEQGVEAIRDVIRQGAAITLGASSSAVAVAAGKEAAKHNKLFFATLSYANETTHENGHRHIFREPYSAWMTARALSFYLNNDLAGKRIFYITADYNWGNSTEESIRLFTHTENPQQHPGVKVPFPRPRLADLQAALEVASSSDAEVLMLIQFGEDMATALNLAESMGLKERMQIVVPNLTQSMAASAGAGVMEGVIGAVPWIWQLPFQYDYEKGKAFVEAYTRRFGQYPDSPSASTYSAIYQFRDAVERSRSLDTDKLIAALEGHTYSLLKDAQTWRDFDHQNVQSVYIVRGKDRNEVMQDKYRSDYFEIILNVPGNMTAISFEEWQNARKAAGKLATLE